MTLVTTAGASDADSYATAAEADTYFTARGITAWTGTSTVKEQALRRGATYLENQYRKRWRGIRTNVTQSLAWPRSDGSRNPYHASLLYPLLDLDGAQIATDTVPTQIKNAQIEAALLVLQAVDLEPTLARGGDIKSISKGVGPLSKAITYADSASAVDRYMVIEGLLAGLVVSTPGASVSNVRLVRG